MATVTVTRPRIAGFTAITTMIALMTAASTVRASSAAEAGALFDAALFGMPLLEEGPQVHGVRWAEPRKIRQVEVEFAEGEPLPEPDRIKVEYWHGQAWNGQSDPMVGDAGWYAWSSVDDWTNGQWRNAEGSWRVEGPRWVYTFDSSRAEFPNIGDEGVTYRKTIQVRLRGEEDLPAIARLRTLTESLLKPLTVRIHFGEPAEPKIVVDTDDLGYLEVFNGFIRRVLPIADLQVITHNDIHFYTLPKGSPGGLEVDLLLAVDPLDPNYDRTIVTVRSKHRPFSFAADDVAAGQRVLVDDLGMLIVDGEDPVTVEEYRGNLQYHTGRSVYDMIFDVPEQTLMRAWDDMPPKKPIFFTHGLPGNRNAMRQAPEGSSRFLVGWVGIDGSDPDALRRAGEGMIEINSSRRWFNLPSSPRDTQRRNWKGDTYRIWLTIPGRVGGRELRDGYLPQLRTWYRQGPILYESQTILDMLHGNMQQVRLDDPSVLLMRLRMVNTSAERSAEAHFHVRTEATGGDPQKLSRREDRLESHAGERLDYLLLFKGDRGTWSEWGEGLQWALELDPGETYDMYFAMPSITLDRPEEQEALRKREFAEASDRVCAYWRALAAKGAQIITPEPWLNDFYKAHIRHLKVNTWKRLDSDVRHAHVGTFAYGDYLNESIMMITDLNRRGYHHLADRCLESFISGQGKRTFRGNYQTAEGCFYESGGHETGDYNKNHGYVLWGLAEHWRYTRDRTWMERVAPNIVKGCEWIIRERQATMQTDARGQRPIEYGFLPAGSLEDVQDFWHWLATNAATSWGFTAAAEALADFGHPEAERLRLEARAYYDDLMRGWTESRIRSPVVRLRDATYVPKFPSRLYERGRSLGWIRETLEGALRLPIHEQLPPDSPETTWILKDYEDNLYISRDYGYEITAFDRFWFSRGGFSMQPQLLDGPIPYLLRDEIEHYVRTFFNGFAATFYPGIRMCSEIGLPEPGYPVGDHFKSSDEAQAAYWLRLMFVHEQGGDLYLGRAIPRYWLADGNVIGIERAATHFGPLTFKIDSRVGEGQIKAIVSALQRNRPQRIYVRFRHPERKPIQAVTVNGRAYDQFDTDKEWVILPGDIEGEQEIVARY